MLCDGGGGSSVSKHDETNDDTQGKSVHRSGYERHTKGIHELMRAS